jgi:hypothetical protein
VFDSEGLSKARDALGAALVQERMRQLILFLAADFISPVNSSTTFEVRDRPYVTILKSVPATLVIPEPTLKFSPRQFARIGGVHLFRF